MGTRDDLHEFEDGTVANPDEVNHNFSLLNLAIGTDRNIEVFESDGTFTVPDDIDRFKVIVTGGGGGVMGFDDYDGTSDLICGGGGAGGTAIKIYEVGEGKDVEVGDELSVTVGSGGIGTGTSVDDGDTSIFNSEVYGYGGDGAEREGTRNKHGASGGGANGGDINIKGGDGGDTGRCPDRFSVVSKGVGGASFWSGNRRGAHDANMWGQGAGGDGGRSSGGYNGHSGVVVVIY